jgi:hypothetical protein
MKINLSAQRRDDQYTLAVSGDTLIINGETFDFTPVDEGDILEAEAITSEYIVGNVTRTEGQLQITLILPHGYPAPESTRFPEPIVNPPDGPVTLPAYQETADE